jgi:O-antigen ligase
VSSRTPLRSVPGASLRRMPAASDATATARRTGQPRSGWDLLRPTVGSPWFLFAVSLPLALLASALDTTGEFRGGATRYVILIAFLAPLVLYLDFDRRRLLRSPGPAHLLLAALFTYGILGTIVGKLFVGTATSFLPVFVPMSVALLAVVVPTGPSRGQARALLMAVAAAALLYLAMHMVSITPLGSGFARYTYHHEKSFYIPAALASTWYLARWYPLWRIGVVGAALMSIVVVADNPAATYVAVVVAMLGTAILCSRRITPAFGAALCGVVLVLAGTLYVNIDVATEVASDYFAAVGKTDNTPMRRLVVDEALQRISQDPLYAEHFAGELAIGARFSGRYTYVPAHNDYLQLTTGGGIIALLLFGGWAVAVNYDALRRLHALRALDRQEEAALLRVLLAVLNTMLVTAAINPIITQVHLGTIMFGVAAVLWTLDEPVTREDRAL